MEWNFESPEQDQDETIYSVSQINRSAAQLLRARFSSVWVEGEISNLVTPASGHIYFTLKDAGAQLRCALFRGNRRKLGFEPSNGMLVQVRGEISLFEPRGDYQLIVERMDDAGEGRLRRELEALKLRLSQQGLFNPEHKKPLPQIPSQIGVITSPSGAAIRDILTVLRRRFAAIPVIIYPTLVQGEQAAPAIIKALKTAEAHAACDLFILARGGGSLEDLWPFNDEALAHAIFACKTPIISGVGHEIDFTIADAVADLRASTPSAAAEAAVPDSLAWLSQFQHFQLQIERLFKRHLQTAMRHLDWLSGRLQQKHPVQQLQLHRQRFNRLQQQLHQQQHLILERRNSEYQQLALRLKRFDVQKLLAAKQFHLEQLRARLESRQRESMTRYHHRFLQLARGLETVSPLATLSRGYAIVQLVSDDSILRKATDTQEGTLVKTKLAEGSLICKVEKINDAD